MKNLAESIRFSTDIARVVSDYVVLKGSGNNLKGLCPFHQEKTPSFSVSPTKGIYKCFGCGKGGNSVNFVMEFGGFIYPEALRELAKKYNIEIHEKDLTPDQIDRANKRDGIFLISAYANKFFQEKLWHSKEGEAIGLSYFNQREFSKKVAAKM